MDDSYEMQLSGVGRAFGCEDIVFCAYCQHIKNKGLLTPESS